MAQKDELSKTLQQIFERGTRYRIPLYQRNYAWRDEQIGILLQDIYDAYRTAPKGHYFLGSLVVLKHHDGEYEVIDGQQRLTTLSLILRIVNYNEIYTSSLYYDSRPEVEDFFNTLFVDDEGISNALNLRHQSLEYLKKAILFINEAKIENGNNESLTFLDYIKDDNSFLRYLMDNVYLVRVEIPEDTDVASYFEIMNNRGVQLQKHEILKALLLNKIKEDRKFDRKKQEIFSMIWDACSDMDEPVQKFFKSSLRAQYFGATFDDFLFSANDCPIELVDVSEYTISEILNEGKTFVTTIGSDVNSNEEDYDCEVSKYSAILDFPNFLMHVLKVYHRNSDINVQLHEKYLLDKNVIEDVVPMDFVRTLLFCKVVFDRFIVKTEEDGNSDDGVKWSLRKPIMYPAKKNGKIYNVLKEGDSFEAKQKRDYIIHAISMLQVTFRSRVYKNWLYSILEWFAEQDKAGRSLNEISADEYLDFLNKYILDYYDSMPSGVGDDMNSIKRPKEQFAELPITRETTLSLGTNTPHFLFNFIDYLYWTESQLKRNQISYIDDVEPFEFKYWNSVEHHYAQKTGVQYNGNNLSYKEFIDNLGNLCLISKSVNSSLSDRDVKEKVRMNENNDGLGAKRRIMYAITKANNYEWGEEQIHSHYNDLIDLLAKRKQILQ